MALLFLGASRVGEKVDVKGHEIDYRLDEAQNCPDAASKNGGLKMPVVFLDPNKLKGFQDAMNNDPEFKLAARFMSEDVLFESDGSRCRVTVRDGTVTEIKLNPPMNDHWSFAITTSTESWDKLLQSSPPPSYTGLNAGMLRGNLQIMGDIEIAFAYLWAMNRMTDLMRQVQNE